jgi:hypothetical protein
MRLSDFEALVRRLARDVPAEFLAGVEGVEVSPSTLPHPTRSGIYTLGECIPIPSEGEHGLEGIRSRVVLYHGSFQALARISEDFDWRQETWETLTHELRHHLEWRARIPDLEAFDWAAEQNFARADGEPFAPEFHLAAERIEDGVFRLDDDYFIDRTVGALPAEVPLGWHGARYTVTVPAEATLPAYLTVTGVSPPPPGDLVLVLRERTGVLDLFRRRRAPYLATVAARPLRE